MKKTEKPIRAEQPQKLHIPETMVKLLAEMDEGEQQRVLGFAQGVTFAKLGGKSA